MKPILEPKRPLGRLHAPDARDLNYPSSEAVPRSLMARLARRVLWSKRWTVGLQYVQDQGFTSTCVGCAWKHLLIAKPIQYRAMSPDYKEIYKWCIAHDEFPQNDFDEGMQFGTSVRAGAEYLVHRGFLTEYRWAQNIQDMIEWLYSNGPIVMGTLWFDGMFSPDASHVVTPTGPMVGGHAYLVRGHSKRTKQFRCVNSWGIGWGDGGDFYISEADMMFLLTADGEACCAVEKART